MADNELMVLIYETLQKQLNQFKDSRVVIQTLCNRTAELEKLADNIDKRMSSMEDRISAVEKNMLVLRDVKDSNVKLNDSINAMRGTLSTVVAPGIQIVSNAHKDIKQSIRGLTDVHKQVMDEFEQYELRLVRIEDEIRRLMRRQILAAEVKQEDDNVNNPKTEKDSTQEEEDSNE